ncbi:hypothetical protein GF376_02735 [Candidatus Peregrinibacteria bacterium]|nr:hypothetical protein [Candidatus Peregrinibacteria bacterium]
MNEYLLELRLNEIEEGQALIKEKLDNLLGRIEPAEELWDNSDLIRNWKVSERTLSDWRKDGLIDYVQVRNKIFYTRASREKFLEKNLFKGGE